MCCVGGCDKRLSERLGVRSCVRLAETLGEELLSDRFGKMLCKRLGERKGPNFLL